MAKQAVPLDLNNEEFRQRYRDLEAEFIGTSHGESRSFSLWIIAKLLSTEQELSQSQEATRVVGAELAGQLEQAQFVIEKVGALAESYPIDYSHMTLQKILEECSAYEAQRGIGK